MDYTKSPKNFFEQYHSKYDDERTLINPNWEWWRVKYHYNLVELSIMNFLMEKCQDKTVLKSVNTILDIGGGTGHWLDFYGKYVEASSITMVDFSEVVVGRLSKRYPDVNVCQLDITEFNSEFSVKFDVVNAIGVMFHIAEDSAWESAVANLCSYIKGDGIAIIGGEFGENTYQVSHHRRARSYDYWSEVLNKNGCKISGLKVNDWVSGASNGGIMDNVLAFVRK